VRFALRFTPLDAGSEYVATDYNCGSIYMNPINTHLITYGGYRVVGIPAGSYSVQLRWRRSTAAAASIYCDNGDLFMIELDERPRAAVPIL
jgi:hypothetical protein